MGGAIAIVSGISCTDLVSIIVRLIILQGKLKELQNNEKAVGTVTGIIDGIGSFGAAVGQILIGTSE